MVKVGWNCGLQWCVLVRWTLPGFLPNLFFLRDLWRSRMRKLGLNMKNFSLCHKASSHIRWWCIFYAHTRNSNDIRPAVPSRGPSSGIFRDQPAPTNHIVGFGAPARRPWLGLRGLTNAFPRPSHQMTDLGGLGNCWLLNNLLRETLSNPRLKSSNRT
jgi:hypothetical protein